MDEERTEAEHEILIESPVEEIWEALTTEDGLAPWFGPGTQVDAEPGGDVVTPDVVTGEPKRGVVTDVEHERRLSFTWWPEADPDRSSTVTIEIEPAGPQTVVHVTETVPLHSLVEARAAWAWRGAAAAAANMLVR